MLSERLNKKYKKNDADIYQSLDELSYKCRGHKGQKFAIKNAKKLRTLIQDGHPHNYNPSTSVDLLVEELNQYLKK